LLGSLCSACFTWLALLGLRRVQAALAAQGEDGGGCGQRWGGASKLASLGSRCGLHRAKLGGGQRCLFCSRCLARARWRLQGVGVSASARESASVLGHWQQRVGIGTSLRRAADASARAARSRPGVKVGGGQRRSLRTAHITGGARQSCGGGSGACFTCVARALAGNGGVLGVVRWRGMSGRQWWRIGGAMAFSQCWRWHTGV
jgi:hypothetical protein